jgi:tRNA1Val (adenine37-N6)-methyltransferase
MKVGTDGVLLGAWCPLDQPARILDIGTGSGLVALMLAQRCPEAQIDAIDLDSAAVEQAQENFNQSVFRGQLTAVESSLQAWNGGPYDLIVSNPPYFQNSLKNPDEGRKTARHTDTLSFDELIAHSVRLLTSNGRLALILPAETEKEVLALATSQGLHPTHITRVFSKATKPARRILLCFAKTESPLVADSLVLENDKGDRSRPYQELCKDFYL